MLYKYQKIIYLITLLFFTGVNLTAQNLKVRSVEFPDTVTLGEIATLKGYILNDDNIAFTDSIKVFIDVEDTVPVGILTDGEVNDSIIINQTMLAPNDSVYFEKNLLINAPKFRAGTDLVVVWPHASAYDGIVDDEANMRLTFVLDENEIIEENNEYDFLPESILQYIVANYHGVAIDYVSTSQTNFEVNLSNGIELYFSIDGDLLLEEDDNDYSDDDDDNYDDDDEDYTDDDDDGHDEDNDYSDDDDEGESDNDDEGYSDDDDGHEDDDDSSHDEDDEDDHDSSDDDDDDDDEGESKEEDDNWGKYRFLDTKVSINRQAIQIVISNNNFKIKAIDLYTLNGRLIRRLSNQLSSTKVNLPLTNINSNQLGILKIYLVDEQGSVVEINERVVIGF